MLILSQNVPSDMAIHRMRYGGFAALHTWKSRKALQGARRRIYLLVRNLV